MHGYITVRTATARPPINDTPQAINPGMTFEEMMNAMYEDAWNCRTRQSRNRDSTGNYSHGQRSPAVIAAMGAIEAWLAGQSGMRQRGQISAGTGYTIGRLHHYLRTLVSDGRIKQVGSGSKLGYVVSDASTTVRAGRTG